MVDLECVYRTPDGPRGADLAIRALAETQHGVLEYRQLLKLGMTPSAITRRVKVGRLVVLHRGVYAVGHSLLPAHGREMAAVFAAGPGTVLSHRSAGVRLGIVRWTGRVEVTSPRSARQLDRVTVHTSRGLAEDDRMMIGPIPATAWARTVIDLAVVLRHDQMVRALEQSVIEQHYDQVTLDAAMARAHGHHGLAALTSSIAAVPSTPQHMRSPLEDMFLAMIRAASPAIEEYEGNAWLDLPEGSFEIDALWRNQRLAVELDSRYHDTPSSRLVDARRDRILRANSFSLLRFRERELKRRPKHALNEVRRHLAAHL